METEFNEYDFENYLTDEFFNGNEKSDIGSLIKQRLATDEGFKEKYELWLEESGYENWKEFYKTLQDEDNIAWKRMFPNGDEDDEITDYLTKE